MNTEAHERMAQAFHETWSRRHSPASSSSRVPEIYQFPTSFLCIWKDLICTIQLETGLRMLEGKHLGGELHLKAV